MSLDRFREPDREWPQPRKDADAISDDDLTYEQRLENSIKSLTELESMVDSQRVKK